MTIQKPHNSMLSATLSDFGTSYGPTKTGVRMRLCGSAEVICQPADSLKVHQANWRLLHVLLAHA